MGADRYRLSKAQLFRLGASLELLDDIERRWDANLQEEGEIARIEQMFDSPGGTERTEVPPDR